MNITDPRHKNCMLEIAAARYSRDIKDVCDPKNLNNFMQPHDSLSYLLHK